MHFCQLVFIGTILELLLEDGVIFRSLTQFHLQIFVQPQKEFVVMIGHVRELHLFGGTSYQHWDLMPCFIR